MINLLAHRYRPLDLLPSRKLDGDKETELVKFCYETEVKDDWSTFEELQGQVFGKFLSANTKSITPSYYQSENDQKRVKVLSMERVFNVSDQNLAMDPSMSQLRDPAREVGCGGEEKDSTDNKSDPQVTIDDTMPQVKNEMDQGDFDREKHLSIGLNEKKSRDIEASLAKIKFRRLGGVEQIEVMSNRGDTSAILNDVPRIKAERKQRSILNPNF